MEGAARIGVLRTHVPRRSATRRDLDCRAVGCFGIRAGEDACLARYARSRWVHRLSARGLLAFDCNRLLGGTLLLAVLRILALDRHLVVQRRDLSAEQLAIHRDGDLEVLLTVPQLGPNWGVEADASTLVV